MLWSVIRVIFKTSSVTPEFFYVFNLVSSFSTCSQSFNKICVWEVFGANVLKTSNFNFLLTEREGRTGECWPEVVTVRTEQSEVRTKTTEGQYSPVRLEQARLVSSLLYGIRLMLYIFFFQTHFRSVKFQRTSGE